MCEFLILIEKVSLRSSFLLISISFLFNCLRGHSRDPRTAHILHLFLILEASFKYPSLLILFPRNLVTSDDRSRLLIVICSNSSLIQVSLVTKVSFRWLYRLIVLIICHVLLELLGVGRRSRFHVLDGLGCVMNGLNVLLRSCLFHGRLRSWWIILLRLLLVSLRHILRLLLVVVSAILINLLRLFIIICHWLLSSILIIWLLHNHLLRRSRVNRGHNHLLLLWRHHRLHHHRLRLNSRNWWSILNNWHGLLNSLNRLLLQRLLISLLHRCLNRNLTHRAPLSLHLW